MNSIDDLMEHAIQDLFSAENQIIEALPQLIDQAQDQQLRQALQQHLEQTRQQVERLQQISQQLGIDPDGADCMAMQGLVDEAQDLLSQLESGPVADAAIIGAAQKVEHYEIAAYGTARTLAQQAGQQPVADLLETTLQEEKDTDQRLTQIATRSVNEKAVQQ